jgi:hypothetical protein
VCAAPTLPVWPGSHPEVGFSMMIAAGELIDREANPKPPDKG